MYRKTIQERLDDLQTSHQGLSREQRIERRKTYGYNEIMDEGRPSFISLFFDQFRQLRFWILLIIAALTAILNQYEQAVVILLLNLVSMLVGAIQINRANKAISKLHTMTSPTCLVLEEGKITEIETRDLVPGDIVLLDSGDIVPADGRLLESYNLQIDESLLTGEARSVEKDIHFAPLGNIPLGERINMVYASTVINSGKGSMLVTNTGMDTEMGKIAFMLYKDADDELPLTRRLAVLGRYMAGLFVILVLLYAAYAFFFANKILDEVLLSSLSLLAAVLPQGLAAMALITLGLGLYRLAKKNAMLKRMRSVELLGSVSVICADKGGTLTENKIKVTDISTGSDEDESLMKKICILCNDVHIGEGSFGDPVELALMDFALDGEFDLNELREQYPRLEELAFDASRKRMTTLHQEGDRKILLSKGGLEEILEISTSYCADGESYPLDEDVLEGIRESYASYAAQGKRILAMAYRYGEELREEDMIFLGLVALLDPPLEGVKESVKVCKRAGIRPILITGDHLLTAIQVAKDLGILTEGYEAISGEELNELSQEEFAERIEDYSVYAGVTPQQRLRILDAWQGRGDIVAMTGKSVIDTASLNQADLGVAMDKMGTDVSKSAADILIKDDSFTTLVGAIEEGRMLFANLRRSLRYIFSSNLSLIILLIAGLVVYGEMPLLPMQILWVGIMTMTLPSLALEVEPKERNIMMREPRPMLKTVLNTKGLVLTLIEGFLMAFAALVAYVLGKQINPDTAQTMAFMTIGFVQLFHAFNLRNSQSVLGRDFFSNKSFFPAVLLSGVLLVITVLLDPLHKIFGTRLLGAQQWGLIFILAFGIVLVTEIRKLFIKE